jgi:hypothetical protein
VLALLRHLLERRVNGVALESTPICQTHAHLRQKTKNYDTL